MILDGSVPPLCRSFFYQLFLHSGADVISGMCVSNGQPSTYTADLFVAIQGGYRDGEYGMLTLDPSGDRINVSWSFNDLDAALDLTSSMIPQPFARAPRERPRRARLDDESSRQEQ